MNEAFAFLHPDLREALALLTVLGRSGKVLVGPQLMVHAGVAPSRFDRVVRRLVDSGLVLAHRGRAGGYGLACQPEALQLGRVLGAMPLRLGKDTGVSGLNDVVSGWLRSHVLADLLARPS